VPSGWIAVGQPPVILPPAKHCEIWAAPKPLDFPGFVYGVYRTSGEENLSQREKITQRRSDELGRHHSDDNEVALVQHSPADRELY
jgi:hypothetical protein